MAKMLKNQWKIKKEKFDLHILGKFKSKKTQEIFYIYINIIM